MRYGTDRGKIHIFRARILMHRRLLSREGVYVPKVNDNQFDEQGEREYQAVKNMLASAVDNGLEVEVLLQFGHARAEGQDTVAACRTALAEWDI